MNIKLIEAKWNEKRSHWRVDVQKDGVRKTFYSSIQNKKGKKEAETKAKLWYNQNISDFNVRFGKAYEMFLEEKKLITSHATWDKHNSIGNTWLLPNLEHCKLSSIKANVLENIIIDAYRKGKAKKTLINIKGSMSAFATFCKKNGWAFPDLEFVEIPKNAPTKQKTILQSEDIKNVFNNDCNEFYIHAFRFFVVTGLRRGELCGLKNEDIDGQIAHIRRAINEYGEINEGKTKNARRDVALCSQAIEILEQQKALLKKHSIISPYVFPRKDGTASSPNSIYTSWVRYRNRIGLSCNLHELRHTFISYASAAVSEELLKKVVGHSKSMDTSLYIHKVNDDAKKVADMLNSRFQDIL